jgi:hypothetical protein
MSIVIELLEDEIFGKVGAKCRRGKRIELTIT